MRTLLLVGLLTFPLFGSVAQAQSESSKREFRAVWIATVSGLDWPKTRGITQQQNELRGYLDVLRASGVNAILFQVRSEGDALYASDIEPWSHVLAGAQGQDPGYDPLEFAIEEAHKRGMELHAWLNPFRAEASAGSRTLDDAHVSKKHPDWILKFGGTSIALINPGIPDARDYNASIVADIVRRYDVDGIHFDDYFYPYPSGQGFSGITNEDESTFAAFRRGFIDRGDWRRDNINLFVQQVADSIAAINPNVKYGISPFGIWKSGTPSGTNGLNAYSTIYADALAWTQARNLDYLTPQLYWNFGGGQDYAKLAPWWQSQMAGGRHLYPGLGAYRDYAQTGVPAQIRFNQTTGIEGSVLFRSFNVTVNGRLAEPGKPVQTNYNPLRDSLQQVLWKTIALPPTMPWKDDVIPNAPTALARQSTPENIRLTWEAPSAAGDGDEASWYAVYRFEETPDLPADLENAANLLAVVPGDSLAYTDRSAERFTTYQYVVTALDRTWNESAAASPVTATSSTGRVEAGRHCVSLLRSPTRSRLIRASGSHLGASERVTARVYSTLGQEVARLAWRTLYPAGTHSLLWSPDGLASGAYFVVMETDRVRKSVVVTRAR